MIFQVITCLIFRLNRKITISLIPFPVEAEHAENNLVEVAEELFDRKAEENLRVIEGQRGEYSKEHFFSVHIVT